MSDVIVLFPDFDVDPNEEDPPWTEADDRREAMDEPPEDEGRDLIPRLIDLLWESHVPYDTAEKIVLDLLDSLDWSK